MQYKITIQRDSTAETILFLLLLICGGLLLYTALWLVVNIIILIFRFPMVSVPMLLIAGAIAGYIFVPTWLREAEQAREREAQRAALVQAQATAQVAATATVQAIELSGTWTGTTNDNAGTYNLMLEISQNGSTVSGTRLAVDSKASAYFGLLRIDGRLNGATLTYTDQQILDERWANNATSCITSATLRYGISAQGRPTLEGTWTSQSPGCRGGAISLTRGEQAQMASPAAQVAVPPTPLATQVAAIQAINVSGTWRGTLDMPVTGQGRVSYNVSLEIKQDGATITGTRRSSDTKAPSNYGLLQISGDISGAILTYTDQRVIDEHWPGNASSCITSATLRHSISVQGTPTLAGTWTSRTQGCPGGNISLTLEKP